MATERVQLFFDEAERGVVIFRHEGDYVGRSTVRFTGRRGIQNRIRDLLRNGSTDHDFTIIGGTGVDQPGQYLETVHQALRVVKEEFPGFDYRPVPISLPTVPGRHY